MTIWKYELLSGIKEVPLGAKLLTIQTQGLKICAWFLVNEHEKRTEMFCYRIIGTGHPVDAGLEYITTFQDPPMVWHVFRETPTNAKTVRQRS